MQLNHRSYNPPFCPIEATHGSGLYGALIWIFVFLCWTLQTRAFASDLLNLSSQQSCVYQAVIQWRDDKRTSIRPHGGAQTSNPPCTLHAAAVDAPPGARHRPQRGTATFLFGRTIPSVLLWLPVSVTQQIQSEIFHVLPI